MKTLLKIYSACCLIFIGFLLFFLIPLGALPFADSVTIMILGGMILAAVGFYIYNTHSREGFELGWFLANRGGFWFIVAGCFGLLLFLSGVLLYIAPEAVQPAFERGAMPFGAVFVVLFWFSLIYMFAFLTFSGMARATAFMRIGRFERMLGSLALTVICLLMAVLFFSLFVEVVNDIFARLTPQTQRIAVWVFAVVLPVVGIVDGLRRRPSDHLEEEEIKERKATPD